jgi:hypothetical protein
MELNYLAENCNSRNGITTIATIIVLTTEIVA